MALKDAYDVCMNFRENLKSELTYQGMLVKELSEKTGISKRTLDNYLRENGSLPLVDSAVKIAQALHVSVEYLVNGDHGIPKSASAQGESMDETGRLLQARGTHLPEWKKTLMKNICNLIEETEAH